MIDIVGRYGRGKFANDAQRRAVFARMSNFAHVRIINGSKQYARPRIGSIRSEKKLKKVLEKKFEGTKLVKAKLDLIGPKKGEWDVTLKETGVERKPVKKIPVRRPVKRVSKRLVKRKISKEYLNFRRYTPLFSDFETGLMDNRTHKRADHLLPEKISKSGIYKKSKEYESYRNAWKKSQRIKFKFKGKTYFWDDYNQRLTDSKGNEIKPKGFHYRYIGSLKDAKEHLEHLEAVKQLQKEEVREERERKIAHERMERVLPTEPKFKLTRQIDIATRDYNKLYWKDKKTKAEKRRLNKLDKKISKLKQEFKKKYPDSYLDQPLPKELTWETKQYRKEVARRRAWRPSDIGGYSSKIKVTRPTKGIFLMTATLANGIKIKQKIHADDNVKLAKLMLRFKRRAKWFKTQPKVEMSPSAKKEWKKIEKEWKIEKKKYPEYKVPTYSPEMKQNMKWLLGE